MRADRSVAAFLASGDAMARLLQRDLDDGAPAALACLSDRERVPVWFKGRLMAGCHRAHLIHDAHLRRAIGSNPLAEGAHDWPAALDGASPGTGYAHIAAEQPLRGWRMWAVTSSGTLVAPFMATTAHGGRIGAPGTVWTPGANTADRSRCLTVPGRPVPNSHPHPDCQCGIRVVRSLTVLGRFARRMRSHLGAAAAVAQVDAWGHVGGPAYADDWPHTIRAEHVRIAGPIHLAQTRQDVTDELVERYGVDVAVGTDEIGRCR